MKISRPKATARNLNTLRSATEAAARAGFHAWKSSSNFGGVARFDYQLSRVFPHRVFFEGPRQKMEMLEFLEKIDNAIEHKEIIGRKGREWYLTNCRFDKWSDSIASYIN